MESMDPDLTAGERARLARKGEILYGKSCGPGGRGDCAESFAVHQMRLGHLQVVRDLLEFLDARIAALRSADPAGQLAATEALATRIRGQLDAQPATYQSRGQAGGTSQG
jgi:hypothetical protein